MKKFLSILLACLTLAALCACGSGDGSGDAEAIRGETQEWGKLSLFVPDGNSLVGGSLIDAEDPYSAWILLDSDNMHYYLVGVVDGRETAEANLAATQKVNDVNGGEGAVTIEVNGVTWTGYSYKYNGADCFQLFGDVGGKWVTVSAAYHAYDSAETKAVLESIKVF